MSKQGDKTLCIYICIHIVEYALISMHNNGVPNQCVC